MSLLKRLLRTSSLQTAIFDLELSLGNLTEPWKNKSFNVKEMLSHLHPSKKATIDK